MRIYATYKGNKDIRPEFYSNGKWGKLQLEWENCLDETGELIGNRYSNPADTYGSLRKGGRYLIEFKQEKGNRILFPTSCRLINRNRNCKLIRFLKGEYLFIKGKYKGEYFKDIDKGDLIQYLIWVARNTESEGTIIKVLKILKELNNE